MKYKHEYNRILKLAPGCIYDGDYYHASLEEYVEAKLEELYPSDFPNSSEFPNRIWTCEREHSTFGPAVSIAAELHDRYLNGEPLRAECLVEYLAQSYIEDVTFYVDFDMDVELIPEALKQLEQSIAAFRILNAPIVALFGRHPKFKPDRDCIGLSILQNAVEQCDWHHRVNYTESWDPNGAIELTEVFWDEMLELE
jgi:hypothetical protein